MSVQVGIVCCPAKTASLHIIRFQMNCRATTRQARASGIPHSRQGPYQCPDPAEAGPTQRRVHKCNGVHALMVPPHGDDRRQKVEHNYCNLPDDAHGNSH